MLTSLKVPSGDRVSVDVHMPMFGLALQTSFYFGLTDLLFKMDMED